MDNQEPPSPKELVAPGTPPRKRKPYFSAFGIGCLLSLLIVSVIILVPVFNCAKEEQEIQECGRNMRQLGDALIQYQQDNDDRLPPSNRWATEINRRSGVEGSIKHLPFHCPVAYKTPYGYALNKVLGGQKTTDDSADTLILLFECDSTDFNAAGSRQNIAYNRHSMGTGVSFCYADGHVKHILCSSHDSAGFWASHNTIWKP